VNWRVPFVDCYWPECALMRRPEVTWTLQANAIDPNEMSTGSVLLFSGTVLDWNFFGAFR